VSAVSVACPAPREEDGWKKDPDHSEENELHGDGLQCLLKSCAEGEVAQGFETTVREQAVRRGSGVPQSLKGTRTEP
jgi:hypothetical protein